MRALPIILAATLGLVGCGSDPGKGDSPTSTEPPATTATTVFVPVTAAATTIPAAPSTTAKARSATTTSTTTRPTTTTMLVTTTTRPPTPAEATSRLCRSVEFADEAIQQGNFVLGGLRLSAGLNANEKIASPSVAVPARTMLRSGVNGDAEGYVNARQAASTACFQAGYPIRTGGIVCITAPCP